MRLIIIDGNSIVNRAFYGIKQLSTKSGQFTNAIYGFMNILIKLKQEYNPDALAVAFDLKAPTFRHKMFDGYKAGRKPMPPELASQMPLLKQLLTALGYSIVEKEGYEADDILGTLSVACKQGDMCYIATGDRDSLQLISDNTHVLLASTKAGKPVTVEYDKDRLKEEYGVEPKQMIEIKALMGDASDKIPGVAGIGQKTAGSLIQQYGNIDYIYENLQTLSIKPGIRQKLESDKKNAYLSRELGTICLNAPINTDLEFYIPKPVDAGAAIKLLAQLEMFSLIEKLGLTADVNLTYEPETKSEEQTAKAVRFTEERDLCALLGKFKNENKAYFVTQYSNGRPIAFFFAFDDEVRYVSDTSFDFDIFLKDFFEGEWEKYTTDVKPLYKYAITKNISLKNVVMDLRLAGYILNPSETSYSTTRLAAEYFVPIPEIDCPSLLKEDALNAAILPKLCEKIYDSICESGQERLYREIELPIARVLAGMENNGFLVDRTAIEAYGDMLSNSIDEITNRIFNEVGFSFNLNSPKQLGEALFDKLGLPYGKKTKRGYSTNADVLQSLSYDYPIVADVLKYRMLAKLKSTYCDGLTKQIEPDGRIHTVFNQTETRTGRISSLEPNLQNIPVRYKEGREIRRFFVAGEGKILVDADYSQIELRVLAHIANDTAMINAFNNGEDIHLITASQVFNLPPNMITPLMRTRAKAVNFGIVYGIGAFSLAKDIGVTRRQADEYIKGYLSHYSGVDRYMKQVVQNSKQSGYAQTIFGRRRYLPELASSNKITQAFGERVARNMPVQGTAADIIKIAMIRVYDRLKKEVPEAKLILQVHDELIVECDRSDSENVKEILIQEMENACKLKVPLVVDAHIGKTWYATKG